jgi:hypothetical protein
VPRDGRKVSYPDTAEPTTTEPPQGRWDDPTAAPPRRPDQPQANRAALDLKLTDAQVARPAHPLRSAVKAGCAETHED